jgi:chemotaxis protein MotA
VPPPDKTSLQPTVLQVRKDSLLMNIEALLDPWSLAIVLGGTAFATLLRCGPSEWRALSRCIGQLGTRRFSYVRARAELAPQVEVIRHDGVLRAQPDPSGDVEIAEATDALIRHRSVSALIEAHERHRRMRQELRRSAVQMLAQAGELAPVFGLVGTLIALSQMSADGLERGALMGAVATAVLTTLYGLLTAHLLIFPLARMIERRGDDEEAERQKLMDWLASQVAPAMPSAPRRAAEKAA